MNHYAECIIAAKSEDFCPEYNDGISRLANHVNEDLQEFEEYFTEFSDTLFMIRPLWEVWSNLSDVFGDEADESEREYHQSMLARVRDKGRSQFYFDRCYYFLEDSEFLKLLDFVKCSGHVRCHCRGYHGTLMKKYKWAEKELSFPHSDLKDTFRRYDVFSSVPVSSEIVKMYKENMALYNGIKAVESEDEKWFNAVLNINDEEFITQNIEHRITTNVSNKNLWKMYIEYWRTKNPVKMLEIYSNYVRFFLNDFEMIQKYRQETEKYGHPQLDIYWKKCFNFERVLTEPKEFIYKSDPYVAVPQPHNIPKASFENPVPQEFPFRSTVMKYILENANPKILNSLFQTCKYFFALFKTPICHRLVLGDEVCTGDWGDYDEDPSVVEFDRQALQIRKMLPSYIFPLNLHISNSLLITSNCHLKFENVIPHIAKCDIRILSVYNYKGLTEDEFNFFVKSGTIEQLNFFSKILNKEGNELSIQEILEKIPNMKVFCAEASKAHADKTFEVLKKCHFNNKIEKFSVHMSLDHMKDTYSFCEFAEKNFAIDADIQFKTTKHDDAPNIGSNFKNVIEKYFENNMFFKFEHVLRRW